MRKIEALLNEYGESHQNHTNKFIHWICVPLIFFSVVGLIWSIPSGILQNLLGGVLGNWANWATITLAVVLVYYISLSWQLAIGMLLFTLFCTWMANQIALIGLQVWLVSIIVFTFAWIGQFYGHKIEGKKPSFFKDLQFLLIGPAWLMHFIYKKVGLKY